MSTHSFLLYCYLSFSTVLLACDSRENTPDSPTAPTAKASTLADAAYARGKASGRAGKYDEALAAYEEALRLKSDMAEVYSTRAFTYIRLGRVQEALVDLDRAIELRPADPDHYRSRADVLARIDLFSKALVDYDRVIELTPKDAGAYSNRANVFRSLNKHAEALRDNNKAIELEPNNPQHYYGRALTNGLIGNIAATKQDFRACENLASNGRINNLKPGEMIIVAPLAFECGKILSEIEGLQIREMPYTSPSEPTGYGGWCESNADCAQNLHCVQDLCLPK